MKTSSNTAGINQQLHAAIQELTTPIVSSIGMQRYFAISENILKNFEQVGATIEKEVGSALSRALFSALRHGLALANRKPLDAVTLEILEDMSHRIEDLIGDKTLELSLNDFDHYNFWDLKLTIEPLVKAEQARVDVAKLANTPLRSTEEIVQAFNSQYNPEEGSYFELHSFLIYELRHPKEIELTGYSALRQQYFDRGIAGKNVVENLALARPNLSSDETCDIWAAVATRLISDLTIEGHWLD
jgi:hypothetical protein